MSAMPTGVRWGGERLLDPLWVLLREPLDALGFEIERLERSKAGIVERVAARKPGAEQH